MLRCVVLCCVVLCCVCARARSRVCVCVCACVYVLCCVAVLCSVVAVKGGSLLVIIYRFALCGAMLIGALCYLIYYYLLRFITFYLVPLVFSYARIVHVKIQDSRFFISHYLQGTRLLLYNNYMIEKYIQ